ncbi:hypothetical protein SAMD00023353_3101390 [Rosellinia necatrix]|uniref:Infection structure specific protein n=1 Tax=Rosellinia necatrix TaxID=77044 RepID=A0A1W2TSL0_ROSNE|nr:hypothetical protein SAMD00023353_3101390 [Rosellinia necatrix]
MYNAKILLALATLADVSLAQTSLDPACSSLITALIQAGPTIPAELAAGYGDESNGAPSDPTELLSRPDVYVEQICAAVGSLPSSLLPEFASWGSSLLHFASVEVASYDAIVTQCIATDDAAAAASITSYIHSIVSAPDRLCQPTATTSAAPAAGSGNGTASVTPSGNGTSPSTGVPTTSIPTAAAGRPTGAIVGAAALGGLLGAVALL